MGIGDRGPDTSLDYWDTRTALPADFASAWGDCLERSRHAHFALDLSVLAWEATSGRHARAVLVRRSDRFGLLVLRRSGTGWVSGWPWRWQALVGGENHEAPLGLSAVDARWILSAGSRVASPAPLTVYLPHRPPAGVPGWLAGGTVLQSLRCSDEDLVAAMEPNKRRLLRRARSEDVHVATARSAEDFRSFHQLQQEVRARRGLRYEATPDAIEAAGTGWREWELPWMWLLIGYRRGDVISGLGSSTRSGGMLEGRTSASTPDARRTGATVLLGFEEARSGRDLGHHWLNHGGDTPFKREISGRLGLRARTFGWMGGGSTWRVFQFGVSVLRGTRPALARVRRRLRHLLPGLAGLACMIQSDLIPSILGLGGALGS
jgi:hypothetical protein